MNIVLLTSYGFFVWHNALFVPLLQSPSQPNYDRVELSIINITETEDQQKFALLFYSVDQEEISLFEVPAEVQNFMLS